MFHPLKSTATRLFRCLLAVCLFFTCFTEGVAQCGCTDCRCADSLELVRLYDSTGGVGWTNRWDLAQPMTTWYGVSISNDRVKTIALSNNTLLGNIPNLNLPKLQALFLPTNLLNGSIPNFNLPNLQELHLNNNKLSGSIPNFNLPNLEVLYLSRNDRLSGNIPNFNLPNLRILSLASNLQLNGSIPNLNLPKLQSLYLNNNQLSGTIPNFSLPNLQLLLLNNNQLDGCIPKEIKTNCPLITATGGFLDRNPNLATQSWANYWNNNEGACIPCASMTNTMNITGGNVCQGGTALLSAGTNAIAPTYLWSTGETTSNISITRAGRYSVTISQSDGCIKTTSITAGACAVVDTNSCRYKDSTALVAFYRATNMQNATPLQYQWILTQPMTTWKGVALNESGCVECLDLDGDAFDCNGYSDNPPGVGLSGVFPSAIGRLTKLYRLHLRGNRGLTGSIPDSIRYLTNLAALYIDDTGLTGALPDGFQYLTALEDFTANNTPFGAPIPNFFSRIKKMDSFDFTNTKTSGTFPVSLANVDSLRRLYLGKNTMSGRVPIELSSRLLHRFDISDNRFDSVPKLNLVEWTIPFVGTPYFYVQGNRLTFDDVLPNLAILPASFLKNYANQDSIFQKITYTKNVGETLTVDLGIDGALTTNKYLWFKNGIRFDSSNSNTLILRGLQMCDAATYRVEVSNPNAPQLTLYSYDIRLIVNGTTATRTLDTAFCNVSSYRLPNDSLVRTNGTYRGTLKNIRGCDSLMWTVKTTFNSNPTAAIIGRDTQCGVERITLRATGGGTYLWSNGTTADSIQVSNVGTFSVTITNAAGCTSVLSKTIVRNPPLSNDATTNHITCAGRDDGRLSIIPIGGTPNFTYNWTGPNGFLSRSQNLTNLKKGDYWLTVTDARGCSVASNLPLSILEPDSLKIGASSIQNTTCQQNNGAININTITGGTGNRLFSWNNNVTTQNLSNIAAGTYTLSVRDVYNCTATANYVVANVGAVKSTPLSISACSGDLVRGRLVTASTSWTETFRTFQNCDSLVNVAVTVTPTTVQTTNPSICAGERHTLPDGQIVSNAGTYRGRLVGTCGNFVVNLTILPIQTISKTDSFCQNSYYDLPNRRVTLAGTYVDTGTAASGCKTRYQTTLTYRKDILRTVNATLCKGDSFRLPDNRSVNTEGSYISRKTSTTSCDTVITTTLTFRPVVEAFDDEVTLNIGDSATINLLINDNLGSFGGRTTIIKAPTEGTWQRITDSIIRYKAPQILRGPLQILTYRVCMVGCTNNCDSASLRIMLKDKDNDFGRIKNGVATEMQGDEYFEVDSISAYPKAQLFIYNGWNELVFKSAIPYDNRWNGTSQNGVPLPSGVYYYVLRDAAPNRKQLDGKILLLR